MSKAELLLISSVLREQDVQTPRHFGISLYHFHTYKAEWSWLMKYANDHNKAPSRVAFKHEFPDVKLLRADDTGYYCERVLESHAQHEVLRLCEEAMEEVSSGEPMAALKLLAQGTNRASMDVSLLGKNSNVLDDYEDIYNEAARRVEAAEKGGLPGISTGFPTLDSRTGGPQPGHVWIVGARLGEGKSWAMLRMAVAALIEGKKVQFCSLEMSRSQVTLRTHTFLSALLKYEHSFKNMDLMLGKGYSLKEYRKFLRYLRDNLTGQLFVSDMSRGRVTATSLSAIIENNEPDILFVDYITLMGRDTDGWEGVAKLSGDMKTLAERYGIPIVLAAQMNRGGHGREPAGAENLAESDAIGRDADCVVSLKQVSPHVVKAKVTKYRHGPDGYMWWNRFEVNAGVFEECSFDEAQDTIDADADLEDGL